MSVRMQQSLSVVEPDWFRTESERMRQFLYGLRIEFVFIVELRHGELAPFPDDDSVLDED